MTQLRPRSLARYKAKSELAIIAARLAPCSGMPDHDAAADATDLIFTNQHLGAGPSSCEPEIDGGVVVGRDQIAGAPQLDDIRLVFRRSTPDDQRHNGGL